MHIHFAREFPSFVLSNTNFTSGTRADDLQGAF